ncbi:RTA1 like protein [Cadophora sp. DSE1049]|nr:RTA1 like protein [Cadophora sp. DSE1049]
MAGIEGNTGIYPYKPNSKICIVAAILFGGSACLHAWQMLRKRTWFYIPLFVGAVMMTFGYIARKFSAESPTEVLLYIAQSLLIILPPSLYAATIYMIYGRIAVFANAPGASIIRPVRVTKIFVVGDVIAFLIMANTGQKVILFGLFVQLAFFGFFLFVALIFYKRMQSSPARYTIPSYGKHTWVQLIKLLFAAAAIIILRCIFRVIEFGQGHSGYLATHEVYMYIFDALPMFLVQAMFHLVHAGDVMPANVRGEYWFEANDLGA